MYSGKGGNTDFFFFFLALKLAAVSSECSRLAKHNWEAPAARNSRLISVQTELQLPLCFQECCTYRYCTILQQSDHYWKMITGLKPACSIFLIIQRLTEVALMWLSRHPLFCSVIPVQCCRLRWVSFH